MHAALVHLTPILAAEKSKTPFYIAGGVLVVWALLVSVGVGLRVSGFPRTVATERALMAVTAVLVVLAASMAVATSGGSTKAQAAASGVSAGGATTSSTSFPSSSSASGAAQGGTAAPQTASALSQEADPSGKLRFTRPRLTAKAGTVSIAFTNHSPLAHNFTIASPSKVLGATPTFEGGTKTLTLKLAPGTYKFFCSVPGHREAGMEGTLVVS